MRPSPQKIVKKKSGNCLFEFSRSLPRAVTHAVTHLSCDGAELSDRLFGQNKPFCFQNCKYMCMCVLWRYGCIYMISICVADIQLWLLWLNRAITMNANRPLWTIWPISVWLSSVLPCTSVCKLLTNSNQCECLAKSVYVWQLEYVCEYELAYIQSYFFISFYLLLKLFLLYFLVVK